MKCNFKPLSIAIEYILDCHSSILAQQLTNNNNNNNNINSINKIIIINIIHFLFLICIECCHFLIFLSLPKTNVIYYLFLEIFRSTLHNYCLKCLDPILILKNYKLISIFYKTFSYLHVRIVPPIQSLFFPHKVFDYFQIIIIIHFLIVGCL